MGFGERFLQWQNYVHYILLAIGLVLTWELVQDSVLKIALAVFIIDTIIHGVFWFAPGKIRWRD